VTVAAQFLNKSGAPAKKLKMVKSYF